MNQYDPTRNIVRRHDGRPVNVARSRGHLFVCADACCCGRVEDGIAAVPRDFYHTEWQRRRLRNIVHLTVGGCLGPCALANVALLLLDGRARWFHSVNSEEVVLALYDYIEAALDRGALLPPPAPLAALHFTASTWEPRPDGQPLHDAGRWQRRKAAREQAPVLGPGRSATTASTEAASERVVASLPGPAAAPRRNGELVFEEPWQGRAFGMAVALAEEQIYPWDDFRERLIVRIAEADACEDPSGYYERWIAAFERLLAEKRLLSMEELDERTFEFEFGERDDVF